MSWIEKIRRFVYINHDGIKVFSNDESVEEKLLHSADFISIDDRTFQGSTKEIKITKEVLH